VLKVVVVVMAIAAYLEIGWLGVAAVLVGSALPVGLLVLWTLLEGDADIEIVREP
jgi:hypothetical protein